jgi:hypothetical protein
LVTAPVKRRQGGVEAFVRKWNGDRILGDLHPELTGLVNPGRDRVVDLARRMFDRIPVDDILQELIGHCRVDPFFLPPLQPLTGRSA